jgi:hypothetical protein
VNWSLRFTPNAITLSSRYIYENLGLLASRNRGAQLATGDVVPFIDEDAIAAGGRMTPERVAGEPSFLPEELY